MALEPIKYKFESYMKDYTSVVECIHVGLKNLCLRDCRVISCLGYKVDVLVKSGSYRLMKVESTTHLLIRKGGRVIYCTSLEN